MRRCLILFIAGLPLFGADLPAFLHSIKAADLRGDLSFLSSDVLAGRYTPSPGLDVSAEFIAAQFRAAGLKPPLDGNYFQVARMIDRQPPAPADIVVEEGSENWSIPSTNVSVVRTNAAVSIEHARVVVLSGRDPDLLKGLDLTGKAVVVPARPKGELSRDIMLALYYKRLAFEKALEHSGAAVELIVGQRPSRPPASKLLSAEEANEPRPPQLQVASDRMEGWFDQPAAPRTVSLTVGSPSDQPVVLKNVIGLLPGSDPKLAHTYVLLTAHYDHIGTNETGDALSEGRTHSDTDHIYNGANDDGSGTVSVIAIAKAMARSAVRPKRSVVFMTFFGEERGDIGSHYYGAHPVFPIAKTVADLNLEQVGRTDSTEGPQLRNASVTGFDYSTLTNYLVAAGKQTGIKVYLDKEGSDAYFARSDNAALALRGVPAHTLCVAFDYPDYHGLGDEWQKINYDNMAAVDRMVALAVWNIANSPTAPQWNSHNPKTLLFRQAAGETIEP